MSRAAVIFSFVALLIPLSTLSQPCHKPFHYLGKASLAGEYGRVDVEQARACFSSGDCIVILNKPSNRRPLSQYDISSILGPNGLLLSDPVSNSPAVNCHGFSCMSIGIPGLPRNVWIDPKPLMVLLKEFFQPTGEQFEDYNLQQFATNSRLQENDLVIMANGFRHINHTGVLRRMNVGGRIENWVASKLDEGPVVLTPLANLLEHYQVGYVSVYRFRK